MIQFTKYLQAESLSSVVTLTLYLMAFDKDIGKYDGRSFVKQFINVGGMSLFSNYNLLKEDHYPVSSLIDSINLLSQIAKMGK